MSKAVLFEACYNKKASMIQQLCRFIFELVNVFL